LGSQKSNSDVKPYLDEFLMDKYVIDVPFFVTRFVVRYSANQTKKSAATYAKYGGTKVRHL
jgi:ferrochelatase